ncbi:MAG: hypothetical protein H0T76_02240 [Nannocystis sp.]|nr:hypothetical protein [Nannocystis sp.]MBA3545281.1 hypothetical protein [Nannocystis sp.]
MKNLSLASFLGLTLLMTAGCPKDDGNGEDAGNGEEQPWETKWETVVNNLPFPLEGDGKINSLTVGRRESNGNYANRGNIEVLFDLDQPVITVEMKVYDFSDDPTFNGDPTLPDTDPASKGTKERMSLWAFIGAPAMPKKIDASNDCTKDTWKSGCTIGTYYDGLAQPLRSGADLRVHLPKAYRGKLNVETEDNLNETAYPRLGNITVDGLCSNADIQLSQGTAKVKMCRDLEVAPTCPAASIKMCETFKDPVTMEDAAWSSACPCPPETYGQVKILSRKPYAANITVDVPTDTWLNVTVSNDSPDKPNACKPTLEACTSAGNCTPVPSSEYSISGEFNYPSPEAAMGAGFNLTVLSAGCGPVKYFAAADDWSADALPEEEEHGHVKVCTGCL